MGALTERQHMETLPAPRQGLTSPGALEIAHRPVQSQVTAIEQARAVAEVQAAVVVAQQVPRDLRRAEGEMRDACGRLAMANRAFYRVPNRGEGPSVHLARELARVWGNLQYGVHELRRDDRAGMSEVQAFAWDVQTNTRSTRTFQVPHQRMKGKERVALADLGDVYLNNQNVGARAVRECIFTVLPTWFSEDAQELCRRTLEDGEGKPLGERIEAMVSAFATKLGVKVQQIESKLDRKRGQWDAGDVATMQVVYSSIQRGEITVEEEFPATAPTFSKPAARPKAPEPELSEPPHEESPGDPGPPTIGRPLISGPQLGKLHALFSEKGFQGHDDRIAYVKGEIGIQVESTKALTKAEASQVIDALTKLSDPEPQA